MKKWAVIAWGVLGMVMAVSDFSHAGEGKWFVSGYMAQATENSLNHMIRFDVDLIDYYLACVAVGKEFYVYKDKFNLEVEVQVAEHWGHQRYEEVNGVFIFRWLKFPWDHYLDTSMAFGEGLSYSFEDSDLEALRHEDTTRFLNYLKLEWGFNLPDVPDWVLFLQIYHRSGVFGTFDGVSGASNLIGVGLKYRF